MEHERLSPSTDLLKTVTVEQIYKALKGTESKATIRHRVEKGEYGTVVRNAKRKHYIIHKAEFDAWCKSKFGVTVL